MMMSVVDGKLSYKTLKKHRLLNDAFLILVYFPYLILWVIQTYLRILEELPNH